MQCADCSKRLVLFKCVDGEYRCIDCMKRNGEAKTIESEDKSGMYIVLWRLRDENGKEWVEKMEHMTLSDFEVAYGNITDEILWIKMRQENCALI